MFSEFLHPEMQAIYKPEFLVEGDFMVGAQFPIKKPVDIAKKVEGYGIKVSHHRDDDFYLYLPNDRGSMFRPFMFQLKDVSAKVRCKLEDGWFKLYYDKTNRMRDINTIFG